MFREWELVSMFRQLTFLSRIVITSGTLAIILQIFVRALDIQYDGDWHGVWWISEVIYFPAHAITEVSGVLGFNIRGFWGRLFVTSGMIIIGIIVVELYNNTRKSD